MALGSALREARLRRKLTVAEVAAATRMKAQAVEALEKEDFSSFSATIYGKGFIRLYAEHVGLDPRPLIEEYLGGAVRAAAPPAPRLARAGTPAPAAPPPEAEAPPAPPVEEGTSAARPAVAAAPPAPVPAADQDLFASARRRSAAEGAERWSGGGRGRPNERRRPAGAALRAAAGRAAAAAKSAWAAAAEAVAAATRRSAGSRPAAPEAAPADEGADAPDAGRLRVWRFPTLLGIVVVLVFLVSGLSRCLHQPPAADGGATGGGPLRLAVDPPEPYVD